MEKGEEYTTSQFKIFTTSNKISPSSLMDEFSALYSVKEIPDSIFGSNSLTISHPQFSLMFSGKDSVRTLNTNPTESIGLVNQFQNKTKEIPGKLTVSDLGWLTEQLVTRPSKDPQPVKVALEKVPFDTNEVLFVPYMNLKVASSSLWAHRTGEVSEKLGINVSLKQTEQDWTYLNAYEGLFCLKGPAESRCQILISR